MTDRIFGPIDGVPTGTTFLNRQEVHDAGVHRPPQSGISGAAAEGADSIVVSGGYEDDEDYGNLIIYTGHGGRNPATGKQVADQTLTRQNLALARSADEGLPVRIVRGAGGDPEFSPRSGYRYDGLFFVDSYWSETGRDGFLIWRFRLLTDSAASLIVEGPLADIGQPARTATTVQRLVRNTAVSTRVKAIHGHRCQVCGTVVLTPVGPYAEGAHIRPLGRPHDGPDIASNILCLCPNDHVRFDRGAITVDSDSRIVSMDGSHEGQLLEARGHTVDLTFLAYHRDLFGYLP